MAVLVTGGAGYIGSHIVLGLLYNREDVLVIEDLSTGFRLAVPVEARVVRGSDFQSVKTTAYANAISARLNLG